MLHPDFESSYNKLNPEQRKAVDHIEGAVMVIAGPGTGKTQVLATRIAKILLETDQKPQNILALTFTEAAAQNMRQRIVSLIGTDGYYVNIMTFHGFASEVITHYPEKFPIERGSVALSDYERFALFETLLVSSDLKILKPLNSPLYYLKEVMKRISDLKREYITPEKFEVILQSEKKSQEIAVEEYWQEQQEAVKKGKKAKTKLTAALLKSQKNIEKQSELLTLYTKYNSELQNRKRYDFDDMITFVIDAFERDEELLLDYQERFQYILVDEYQDTNAAQNKIVELLGSFWEENPNIFVVGDPHQSIFRFQGASTENMLQFVSKYPTAEVVTLTTGYRCHQEIYDAAYDLICHNNLDFGVGTDLLGNTLHTALTQKLFSAKAAYSHLKLYEAQNETMECFFIVEEIKRLQKNNVSLDEIAILYRNNTDAITIKELLDKWKIPYELSIGGTVFDNIVITQLINLLHCMKQLAIGLDTELLFEVMQYDWIGLDRLHVFKLARIAGKLRKTIGEVLELEYNSLSETYGLQESDFTTLCDFKNKVLQWYAVSKNMLFHEWFSLLISSDNAALTELENIQKPDGFGLMEFVLRQPIKTEHLLAIHSLFVAIKQYVHALRSFSLDDFLQTINTMQEHNLSIPIQEFAMKKNRVTLSTVHSAKGKEWQYVFVMGAVDKKWGNTVNKDLLPLPESILLHVDVSKKEKNEDDRRLFYVALTRASKQLYVSWAKTKSDGGEQLHAMFVSELEAHLQGISKKQVAVLEASSETLLEEVLSISVQQDQLCSQQEREFFTQLVSEFKLSVTAFNTYLRDPHEFLVNSLLKVPRAKTPILSFGTAVHTALELFNTKIQTGIVLSQQDLVQEFETALRREFLSENDFFERLQHGIEVLDFYYSDVLKPSIQSGVIQTTAPLFIEKFFGGALHPTVLFDEAHVIKLSGRMDRVDVIDKNKKTVRVIDYKTGSPKSENVIVGKSDTSNYSERELKLPETIRGRLQRQMVFYKLLAQLDATFDYSVEQVAFDFIEPGGSHKDTHIVRSFTISDQAVVDLKNEIIQVMREIRELKFLELE